MLRTWKQWLARVLVLSSQMVVAGVLALLVLHWLRESPRTSRWLGSPQPAPTDPTATAPAPPTDQEVLAGVQACSDQSNRFVSAEWKNEAGQRNHYDPGSHRCVVLVSYGDLPESLWDPFENRLLATCPSDNLVQRAPRAQGRIFAVGKPVRDVDAQECRTFIAAHLQ